MAEDLTLEGGPTEYSLGPPTSDALTRLRDRWRVQFLSCFDDPRGCILVDELAAGRVKTNGDVVGLYELSAARIVNDLRRLAEDVYPLRAELVSFEWVDARTLRIVDRLVSSEGSIEGVTIVTAEEAA